MLTLKGLLRGMQWDAAVGERHSERCVCSDCMARDRRSAPPRKEPDGGPVADMRPLLARYLPANPEERTAADDELLKGFDEAAAVREDSDKT